MRVCGQVAETLFGPLSVVWGQSMDTSVFVETDINRV